MSGTKIIKDVVVQIGGDPSKLKAALDQSLGDLTGWSTKAKVITAAAGAAFGAMVVSLVALTKASLENADALAKQARGLGLTTAAFQNMALVAEEAGVASEELSSVLGIMQRNLSELQKGTAAQVEAFSALGLSLQDLQNLSPDEQFAKIAAGLNAIEDPARKTGLAMEIFGRSGRATINMIDGYGEALQNAADFNATFGLSLTQLESDGIERANDAMGRVSMVFEGFGTRLAVIVAPALEAAANGFIYLAEAMVGAERTGIQFFNTLSNYQEIMSEFGNVEAAATLAGGWMQLEEILRRSNAKEVLQDIASSYSTLSEVSSRVTGEMARDLALLEGDYPVLASAIRSMAAEVERLGRELDDALASGNVEAAAALKTQLGIAVENLQKAISGADTLSGLDLSGSVSWADTLAQAFWGVADAAAEAAKAAASIPGSLQDATGTYTPGAMDEAAAGALPGAGIKLSPRGAGRPYSKPSGGGGGGGGGGDNPWEARLESLVSNLQTEQETIQGFYDEGLETLREAKEQELLTQEEYNQRSVALQEKYQEQMRAIDRQAFAEKAAAWSGALGDLATLMQTGNKKLFTIGKAAAIAQAAVDGWSAAVSAWDKGMKIGGPPVAAAFAAMSVVRTGAMIANIASQQFGGGAVTGGGSGGGASAVSAADAGPSGVTSITIQGDVIGRNTGSALVKEINDAIAAGHRIDLEWQGSN